MPRTGRIGTYHWGEFWNEKPELFVEGVVRDLRSYLLGLYALNVAYDSGRLGERVAAPPEWEKLGSYALSPLITETAALDWPHSDCGFDEWYFFDAVPTGSIGHIEAFCNWAYSWSLSQWEGVRRAENGFDLEKQLERIHPRIVIGAGNRIFALSTSEDVINRFLELSEEP